MESQRSQKIVVVGAGPVGSLAALYAAARGDDVEIYELRGGKPSSPSLSHVSWSPFRAGCAVSLAKSALGKSCRKRLQSLFQTFMHCQDLPLNARS